MEKELRCRDVGLQCDSTVCAKTEEELLTQLGQHILSQHGIQGFSREFYSKAKAAVREGDCGCRDAETMTSEDCSDYCVEFANCDERCC